MKEGIGGDYLYVAWKNADEQSLMDHHSGSVFWAITSLRANSTVAISQPPANTSAMARAKAPHFSVTATGNSVLTTVVTYQWQSNGFDIPGGISASYTTARRSARRTTARNTGCWFSVPGAAVFSSAATLKVTPDIVPPSLLQAINLGTTNVQLLFSEPVEGRELRPTSRTTFFTNGLAVSSAALSTKPDHRDSHHPRHWLMAANYAVVINGVRDRAAAPNTIRHQHNGEFRRLALCRR